VSEFFEFEQDFVASLRCIPMRIRFKLDTCGVKLKLHQWNVLTQDDRRQLLDRPCESDVETQAYRAFLQALILARSGEVASLLAIEANPDWLNVSEIPASVLEKAESVGETVLTQQWASLSPLQRFALIKLSRSGHENSNFRPALEEFGLV
jgi:hypothetical protein